MLNFRTIVLEDKPLFDRFVKSRNGACDCFLYWYCWGSENNILMAEDELAVYLLGGNAAGSFYCMIPFLKSGVWSAGAYRETVLKAFDRAGNRKENFKLWIPEAVKDQLETDFAGSVQIEEDRDSFEYIYETSAMIALDGHDYRGKRNRIRSFLRRFPDVEYKSYDDGDLASCLEVYEAWYKDKKAGIGEDIKETRMRVLECYAVRRALEACTKVGAKGCVIFDKGRPVGFSIASKCNGSDMVSVHFEKCIPEYRDMYAWLAHEFLLREWSDAAYVNREEDMGDQGLRTSKLSWLPCRFNKIYMGRLL
ncbi:DUF2156 domain-containing protein [bacterium]|nr:DUF2156 domain-containing protein [bacterium]